MTNVARLILLPGLGADHRMFEPQREAFPDLYVPAWITPQPNESLAHYAARLAERIDSAGPMVLGGTSLGGMIAWEMAQQLGPAALVLIGSSRSPEAVLPAVRKLKPLVRRIPGWLVRGTKPLAWLAVERFRHLTKQQRTLLARMYQDSDPQFVQWAGGAILQWQPSPPPPTAIFQIHGADDPILPAARIADAEVIPDAGHLINFTHAERVNQVLRRAMEAAVERV